MGTPFPAIHAGANRAAADKAEHARMARDRAAQLLDEIDELLPSGRPETQGAVG